MPWYSRMGLAEIANPNFWSRCQARFETLGFLVLRINLPFRQQRPFGPPFPGGAARDREGLQRALEVMQPKIPGKLFLGGHSYGGRQATMWLRRSQAW